MGMSGGVDDISPSIHTWPQDRIYSIYAPLRCVKQLATISDYLYTFLDPLHGSMYPVFYGKFHIPEPCHSHLQEGTNELKHNYMPIHYIPETSFESLKKSLLLSSCLC